MVKAIDLLDPKIVLEFIRESYKATTNDDTSKSFFKDDQILTVYPTITLSTSNA